jgi:hypothetical protein
VSIVQKLVATVFILGSLFVSAQSFAVGTCRKCMTGCEDLCTPEQKKCLALCEGKYKVEKEKCETDNIGQPALLKKCLARIEKNRADCIDKCGQSTTSSGPGPSSASGSGPGSAPTAPAKGDCHTGGKVTTGKTQAECDAYGGQWSPNVGATAAPASKHFWCTSWTNWMPGC